MAKIIRQINFTSITSSIIGGLFINFYIPIFTVLIYLLKNINKSLSLYIFVVYLILIGLLISFSSIYDNWKTIFFIAIPHILILHDILSSNDKSHGELDKFNLLIVFLLLISYFYEYLFFALTLGLLLTRIYKNLYVNGIAVIIGYIVLVALTFWQYYDMLKYDNLSQIIVLTGLGFLSFFMFLFKR